LGAPLNMPLNDVEALAKKPCCCAGGAASMLMGLHARQHATY
jgi:hypothetical protein